MLNKIYKRFLFTKGYLLGEDVNNNNNNDDNNDKAFAVCYTLAKMFNIRIVSGYQKASDNMILDAAEILGVFVPKPFYLNFPKSAREFSPDKLLYDQLYHYFLTDVCGDFSEGGHSVFEENFTRSAFSENTEIKDCKIITVPVAIDMINEYVENIFASTRPINDVQYELVKTYIDEFGYEVRNCACKDTAIRLLIDTRDLKYVELINLPDVIKLVDTMNYEIYDNENIKKLNFLNQDRKFVTKVIDSIFENGCYNARDCFEKRAIWAGLLHHIHYKPKTCNAQEFVCDMYGNENYSVYSAFERAMSRNAIRPAVNALLRGKGQGAILRELNYIISRCKDEDDIEYVINSINTNNTIILIQLIMQYSNYAFDGARTFKFTRYNKLRVHTETEEEIKKRKTLLSQEMVDKLLAVMIKKLERNLYGRLGKVYIDSNMYNVALPIQENISNGGYGVLPKGTRIHIEEGKKIRAFTYWEKVDDIDLSAIGIYNNGEQEEFSWRTMYCNQGFDIAFSGDQRSGYNGGSEYFDIDIPLFKQLHPNIQYVVFCNNVYSSVEFSKCICKAGYMLRDIEDSGEVFEPKTVKSSFTINCDSTFAYLFGIDLDTNDLVWLNIALDSDEIIAGETSLSFLSEYFNITKILNVGKFFEMLATEVVSSPEEADVIVSDESFTANEGVEVVKSCDFEKIIALLNNKE